jgi:hypothetical protein
LSALALGLFLLGANANPTELLVSARAEARHYHFPAALTLARQALALGAASPEVTWQLHALVGETAAAMGQEDLAIDAFSKALELHPALDIPPDASPKLWVPFQQALRRSGGMRLELSPHSTRSGNEVRTHVQVRGDGLRLVERARVYVLVQGTFSPVPLSKTDEFLGRFTCGSPACDHYFALLDASGNELLWGGSPLSPLSLAQSSGKPSWLARHWPFMAGSAAGLALGAGFGVAWASRESQLSTILSKPSAYTYSSAASVDSTRKLDRAIALSAGGAALVILGVSFLW